MLIANKLGALGVLVGDLTRAVADDLSHTAAALLFTLDHRGPTTASELAVIAGVTQPTAVRVTKGLIDRGLVERAERAGKAAPLRLTADGARRADALRTARLSTLRRLVEPLAPDRLRILEDLLDTILADATESRRAARITCRLCDHALCDGPLCPIGTRAATIEPRDGDSGTEV